MLRLSALAAVPTLNPHSPGIRLGCRKVQASPKICNQAQMAQHKLRLLPQKRSPHWAASRHLATTVLHSNFLACTTVHWLWICRALHSSWHSCPWLLHSGPSAYLLLLGSSCSSPYGPLCCNWLWPSTWDGCSTYHGFFFLWAMPP